ncbi:TnsA endonuclease N-terminal domain-containing protein [Metapseudomonas boanensis]|uniref:TnsA endonuclease N-terminal domain-containing protein n=1 Tax=Metapseudomonas boanensis TaxID=2822138 RepID=A0ABS5XM18_9GAMM|nr:TnsA endonuclease N-terminal domain-containing protein [Pseudomonas boanensis]MBT8767327.1 TnsA endonuclease N-terminal domain-containing protein [Pseudomonas boanensis]
MHRGLQPVPVARNVSKRTRRGKACYVFMSAKAGGLISLESYEELRRALLFEIDPRVVRFGEQPWTMEVLSGEIQPSREHFKPTSADRVFYTPDFTVRLADGRILIIEVKKSSPSSELTDKYTLAQRQCQQHGFEFRVLEGGQITDVLVRNCEYLTRTSAEYFKKHLPATLEQLVELSHQKPQWKFSELADKAPYGGFGVFVGIANGVFQADLNADLLAGRGEITPAHGNLTHLEVGFV